MTAGANWKSLIICPNQIMAGALAEALGRGLPQGAALQVPNYPPGHALVEMLTSHQPTVCFLDAGSEPERAIATMADLLTANPKLPLVALLPGNDPGIILRIVRQGASEFLIQPFTDDQFGQMVERINKKLMAGKSDGSQSRVYCLMPAKGACGGTTVASNLAFQFKRQTNKRLLLGDLDQFTGTLSFILKLKPNYSFTDALHHAHELDPAMWKSLITQTSGLDVLMSPENSADAAGSDQQDPTAIVDFMRTIYDLVVLDTSGVYGEWNLVLAKMCDELLLVTTNELPALQASQRALSYLDQNRIDRSKIRLVVNRYNRDVGLSKEVIETALHEEVFHVLPSDYDSVQRALIDGKPIPVNSALGKAMVQLGEKLEQKEPESSKKSAGSSSWGGLLSLFSRTSS